MWSVSSHLTESCINLLKTQPRVNPQQAKRNVPLMLLASLLLALSLICLMLDSHILRQAEHWLLVLPETSYIPLMEYKMF